MKLQTRSPKDTDRRGAFQIARRLAPFAARHWPGATGATMLALLLAGMNAVDPLLLKYVVDGLAGADPARAVAVGAGALLVLYLVREAVAGLSNWMTWRVRLAVDFQLRRAAMEQLQRLPVSFHATRTSGERVQRMNRGIESLVGAFAELTFGLLPTLAYLVLSLLAMLRLDWRLSLVALAFAPLPALIGGLAAGEQTRRERALQERWSTLFARLNEVLGSMTTVKSFGRESAERRRFLLGINGGNRIVARGVRTDALVGGLRGLSVALARVAVLALGGTLVARGEISVGTLIAFLGYIGGMFAPVQALTGLYQTLRKARVGLEMVGEILDARDTVPDLPGARLCPPLRGAVEFDRVSFAYPGGADVLRRVSLRVRPGETIALVGPSGSGKTTFLDLLLRLRDPLSGTIRVDGQDVRNLRQASYRRRVGVVRQDAVLFNDTIRANIAYGRPEASDAEVEAAARAANAHDFIMELPEGYDTLAGERGQNLSGGQRQRISIARALLVDPALLVLDEPTSALDAESEELVQDALERLTAGRTTFVVAHRLATVVNADRIVVLRHGRIEEIGTHAELVEADGYYASLVRRQTAGLILPDQLVAA